MKIESSLSIPASRGNLSSGKPAKTESADDGAQVQISGMAYLRSAEPPIDQSRIQEIKSAIAEGRFRINPEAIADRLISTAQELIEAQRKA